MKKTKENIALVLFLLILFLGLFSCCTPRVVVYCEPCPVGIDTTGMWVDYHHFINED